MLIPRFARSGSAVAVAVAMGVAVGVAEEVAEGGRVLAVVLVGMGVAVWVAVAVGRGVAVISTVSTLAWLLSGVLSFVLVIYTVFCNIVPVALVSTTVRPVMKTRPEGSKRPTVPVNVWAPI